ncbi:MAG: antitoxin [Verrucomicrobia bacterium]|nr:antitoxin [Verrucomicrobiota bacterium]
MSKRLQVVVDDHELAEIRRAAAARNATVSDWVRQTLRAARLEKPGYDTGTKIQIIREAVQHTYPTADISDMLDDIHRGGVHGLLP